MVPDNLDEFNDLPIEHKFFATKHKGAILEKENHIWYHDGGRDPDFADRFSGDPAVTGFGGGGTVTCVAIQIAAFLGFDPIILIGCDATYSVPSTVVQSGPDKFGDGVRLNLESVQDDDVNHFDPSYFGAGKRWHSPNAAEMLIGFEKCYQTDEGPGANTRQRHRRRCARCCAPCLLRASVLRSPARRPTHRRRRPHARDGSETHRDAPLLDVDTTEHFAARRFDEVCRAVH